MYPDAVVIAKFALTLLITVPSSYAHGLDTVIVPLSDVNVMVLVFAPSAYVRVSVLFVHTMSPSHVSPAVQPVPQSADVLLLPLCNAVFIRYAFLKYTP